MELILSVSIGGPQDGLGDCTPNQNTPLILREDGVNAVRYTYRVTWKVRPAISTILSGSRKHALDRNQTLPGPLAGIITSISSTL